MGSSSISGEGIDLCWERWICFLLVGGTTSVSSATDTEKSDRIISSWRLLDVHVVSKVPVVDTEVDPPQQFSSVNDDEPKKAPVLYGWSRTFRGASWN